MNITIVPTVNGIDIQCTIFQDVFTGRFYSTLMGGEFSNCHGQGSTADESVRCLKIRVYQLRNKKS